MSKQPNNNVKTNKNEIQTEDITNHGFPKSDNIKGITIIKNIIVMYQWGTSRKEDFKVIRNCKDEERKTNVNG